MASLVEKRLAGLVFWVESHAERDALFAALRAADEPVYCPVPGESGFYALTRYGQVTEACRNPQVFSSQPTAVSLVDPPQTADYTGSMISLHEPRHARHRRASSRA